MRTLCALLTLIFFLAACQSQSSKSVPPPDDDQALGNLRAESIALVIQKNNGSDIRFSVDIAATPKEQELGLSGRKSLPARTGMLFPFLLPRTASFWMRDTRMPLDLLFVRTDGSIADILHGKPNDLTPLSTGEPVSAVIEIGGGQAAALGIRRGDRVRWGDCTDPRRNLDAIRNFCPQESAAAAP